MPSRPAQHYDFFLSRRGSVAAIAQEVTDVLKENGYRVRTQDYDIPITANFIEEMHEALKNSRDLVVLFTRDYEQSPYTRMEFTSFEANAAQSTENRRMVILRCEDAPLLGLLSPHVYQDLVGLGDAEERRSRILAAVEGRSQALEPPPRSFIGVPPRIASFTGRADKLDQLDAILMQDKPAAVTQASVGHAAVHGMGGVGKTSLAIEYAHRFRGLYAGVCWCPSETRTGLLSALADLAVTLGVATAEDTDVEKVAKAALRRLAEQRATWLLIYDNVPAPDHIADLLPSAGARVLITSRFSDWSEFAKEVTLDVLPLGEAVALLQERTKRNDAAGAQTLAETLGRLPLALDHAGAYCKRTQVHFADYAEKASSLINAAPRGVGYPRSVAATFDLAISQAVSQCAATEALMAFLAQCAPERIPILLVEGAIDDKSEQLQALAALAEVSLVKHDRFEDGMQAVTVHRLVQQVACARAQAKGLSRGVNDRLIARLTAIYPGEGYNHPKSWPLCAQLTPHVLARTGTGVDGTSNATNWLPLLNQVGMYLRRRAAYRQAELLLRETISVYEEALGPTDAGTAAALDNLASVLQLQGSLAEARALFERSLSIYEKVLGPEHRVTATGLSNLALLLRAQDDLAGARRLLERSLAIKEKVLGPEHADTGPVLNNLALVLQDQGDFPGARRLFERALAIAEKVLGPEHPDTAMCVSNLGGLLQAQSDFTGARALFARALAIREAVFGPEHPDTAQTLHDLAVLPGDQGDLAEARPLLERALSIYEKALGPEHRVTAASLNALANLLLDQGDFAGARRLYERALAIYEKVHGPEHHYTAASLRNVATALHLQGDLAGARRLLERALAICEKVLGSEHAETATSLRNLASVLRDQGDLAGARRLLERALAIFEKVLGSEHAETARSLDNFATLLCYQSDFAEARPLYERALAIYEKVLGPTHRSTNRTRSNLALLLLTSGQPNEAVALGKTALAVHEKVLGRGHTWTKDSARVTADALDALGRTEEATALREKYGIRQEAPST